MATALTYGRRFLFSIASPPRASGSKLTGSGTLMKTDPGAVVFVSVAGVDLRAGSGVDGTQIAAGGAGAFAKIDT